MLWSAWMGGAILQADPEGALVYGNSDVPAPAELQTNVVALGFPDYSQLYALMNDGRLLSVGAPAVPLPAQQDVTALSCAQGSTLALRRDGRVVFWSGTRYEPADTPAEARSEVTAVANGGFYRAVLKISGAVVVWGGVGSKLVPGPAVFQSGIQSIAATDGAILALSQEGRVYSWNPQSSATTGSLAVPAAASSGVARLFAAGAFAAGIKTDGSLVIWRIGSPVEEFLPTLPAKPIKTVALGSEYFVALYSDGTFTAWYSNLNFITGFGARSFQPLQGLVLDVAASYYGLSFIVVPTAPKITVAPVGGSKLEVQSLTLSGLATGYPLAYQWNHNGIPIPGATNSTYSIASLTPDDAGPYTLTASNELGSATSDPPAVIQVGRLDPSRPSGLLVAAGAGAALPAAVTNSVVSVALGLEVGYVVKPDGTARGWGRLPYVNPDLATGLIAITAGYTHAVALRADGTITAWGGDNYRQLQIPSGATNEISAISAGYHHTLALKLDGRLFAWGAQDDGRCQIPEIAQTGIQAIAAGGGHSLAVNRAGAVIGWGLNDAGQVTIPESAKTNVVAVAAGLRHSIALKADGSVVCWGLNTSGQCDVPARARSGIRRIAAGAAHSVAVRNDGTLVGWGDDSVHQLEIPRSIDGGIVDVAAFESATVVIVEPRAPELLRGPQSLTVAPGSRVSLAAELSGYPLSCQWRRNGVVVEGVTGPLLNLGEVRPDDAGTYTLVVSNKLGMLTQIPPAILTVDPTQRRTAGTIVAWGPNAPAQLPPETLENTVAIAFGGSHGLALTASGTVVGWGSNDRGQLDIPALARSGVQSIAAGFSHSVALRTDGSVVAWGAGATQTGVAPDLGQSQVPDSARSEVVAIAARGYRTVALKRDGTVLSWGTDEVGRSGKIPFVNRNLVSLATGLRSTAGLRRDGRVELWTESSVGSALPVLDLVQGQVTSVVATDFDFATLGLSQRPLVLPGTDSGSVSIAWPRRELQEGIVSLAAGAQHVLYLKADGTVDTDGDNRYGQRDLPSQLTAGVLAIAAGVNESVALVRSRAPKLVSLSTNLSLLTGEPLTLSGTAEGFPIVYHWSRDGRNIPGATNRTLSIPSVALPDAGDYRLTVTNSAGIDRSETPFTVRVLPSHGRVAVYGDNPMARIPVPREAQQQVIAVASGASFVSALRSDGGVVSWGQGVSGQTNVPASARSGVTAIACGPGYTLALKESGAVIAWGLNAFGVTDVPVAARSNVTAIAAGTHALALKADGSVIAWGYGVSGQTRVPTAIQGRVRAIAAGLYHSVALLDDGSVEAWGDNTFGQSSVPREAGSGVTAIASGSFHTLALKSDSTVLVWGDSSQGQLEPPVGALRDILAIRAGGFTSLTLRRDGTRFQWGVEPTGSAFLPSGLNGLYSASMGYTVGLAIVGEPAILRLKLEGQAPSLSWSTNLSDLQLERSSAPESPASWEPVPQIPDQRDGRFELVPPANTAQGFFRLATP
jgi:alpha-tubulin suppressor-like RCC1 family protein